MSRKLLALALPLCAVVCGCGGERSIDVVLAWPVDPDTHMVQMPDGLATHELSVFAGASCPTVDEVAAAARQPIETQVFEAVASGTPIGRLDDGAYAFTALSRDASCTPVLFGCESVAHIEQLSRVVVSLSGDAALAAGSAVCGGTRMCSPAHACQ